MSLVRDSREITHLDHASNGDAGGSRAHQTCGELAEVKKTSRAKSIRRNEEQQVATLLNNIHQFKIPAHMFNRSRSAHEINKDRDNPRSERLQQIRS